MKDRIGMNDTSASANSRIPPRCCSRSRRLAPARHPPAAARVRASVGGGPRGAGHVVGRAGLREAEAAGSRAAAAGSTPRRAAQGRRGGPGQGQGRRPGPDGRRRRRTKPARHSTTSPANCPRPDKEKTWAAVQPDRAAGRAATGRGAGRPVDDRAGPAQPPGGRGSRSWSKP